jgi:hypothetical protein
MLILMRSCWFRPSLSKVVAEWLTLLHRTREVTGSNLSPETGYPDFLHDFLQYLQANDGPYIRPWPLRYTSFLIHHSPITLSFEAIYIIFTYWQSIVKQTTNNKKQHKVWSTTSRMIRTFLCTDASHQLTRCLLETAGLRELPHVVHPTKCHGLESGP